LKRLLNPGGFAIVSSGVYAFIRTVFPYQREYRQ
jgi:hypothetical protein